MCISIVASAFQYGWAPTLIPATTTLTSPPRWVCSTRRRNTRATQSRFSLPESMAILAPADRANHSIGTSSSTARSIAASSRTAFGFGDRPHRLGRVAEHGHARDTLGMPIGRGADDTHHDAGGVPAGRTFDRHERAGRRRDRARRTTRPRHSEQREQLVRIGEAPTAHLDELAGIVVERLHRLGRRLGETNGDDPGPARSRCEERSRPGRTRPMRSGR